MATPLGHALAGYAVYSFTPANQNSGRSYTALLCIVIAIVPDLDFLPGFLLGKPALFHQGVTHSLGIALIISLAVAGIYNLKKGLFISVFKLYFISYFSHLIIDFFGPDGRLPYGVPLFWPISDMHFISPIQVFKGMHHAGSSQASIIEWLKGILDIYNLRAIFFEVVLIAPFILLGKWYRRLVDCS